jgi:hypothetical protein
MAYIMYVLYLPVLVSVTVDLIGQIANFSIKQYRNKVVKRFTKFRNGPLIGNDSGLNLFRFKNCPFNKWIPIEIVPFRISFDAEMKWLRFKIIPNKTRFQM